MLFVQYQTDISIETVYIQALNTPNNKKNKIHDTVLSAATNVSQY